MPEPSTVLRDPTSEIESTARARKSPPKNLSSAVFALLSIAKERSDEFMDSVANELTKSGYELRRYRKPTHTKPAPEVVLQDIVADCDVVVEALAD